MLALSSGADSVELKLTVPEQAHRSAIEALGLDPLDAQIRLVCFFDTPDLRLNRQGVIVRARRVQGREDDSVVKLRPVVPDELPAQLRAAPEMVVELDAMPGGYVCSASMKARLKGAAGVKKRLRGKRATSKLFTKPQRAVLRAERARRPRAGRPRGAGADLRAQAQLDAGELRPQALHGDVLVVLANQVGSHRPALEVLSTKRCQLVGRGKPFRDRQPIVRRCGRRGAKARHSSLHSQHRIHRRAYRPPCSADRSPTPNEAARCGTAEFTTSLGRMPQSLRCRPCGRSMRGMLTLSRRVDAGGSTKGALVLEESSPSTSECPPRSRKHEYRVAITPLRGPTSSPVTGTR